MNVKNQLHAWSENRGIYFIFSIKCLALVYIILYMYAFRYFQCLSLFSGTCVSISYLTDINEVNREEEPEKLLK